MQEQSLYLGIRIDDFLSFKWDFQQLVVRIKSVATTLMSVLYSDEVLDRVYHEALRFITNFKTHYGTLHVLVGWSSLLSHRLKH